MKRNNLHVGLMAFAMLLIGASCSDDDNTLSYSTGAVQNTELKPFLFKEATHSTRTAICCLMIWLTIRRRLTSPERRFPQTHWQNFPCSLT